LFVGNNQLAGRDMAEEPQLKSKRRVRNPDTFRERAQKAAITNEKPNKFSIIKHQLAQPFRLIAGVFMRSIVGKALKKVFGWIAKAFNFITRSYFSNSLKELKLVTWPSFTQSRQLTSAVLIFAVIFGASVALVDLGLDKLFKGILLK
jgi:preprotein translocase SecE subunit